jgi:hypothetical protein
MSALAFLFVLTLSPEDQLTFRLRSAEAVTVQLGGERVVLKTSAALRKFRVLRINRGAIDGEPTARIWFGADMKPYEVWPADAPWDLTRGDQAFKVAPEFWEQLNRELSGKIGRDVNVRRERP